ncbi:MAG: glycosyltransferase family 2 protein [Actinobacteria bacterium]|nr:glycosyltransferase family 2 protein [Actinomycetota bacterium]
MTPDVSILIVTYKCRDEARDCLASIYDQQQGVEIETLLLDNNSEDGTVEMIRSEFPQVSVQALEENIGFAAGINKLAELAAGEFVLLLNPDTLVHPHSIERLVEFARANPRHGLYGGRTLNPDGSPHPASCWGKPTLWSLTCFATMLSSTFKGSRLFDPESLGHWQRDTVREVDIVTGCLLLAPATVWKELGGFDLRFFMYGEDADLALRAAALGYRPAITPDAVITHEIGVSSATRLDKIVLLYRSKAALVRKHWPAPKRQLGLGLLWAGIGLRALLSGSVRTRDGSATWRGVWKDRRNWLQGYPLSAGYAPGQAPPGQPGAASGG